jgi:RING finger protein 170
MIVIQTDRNGQLKLFQRVRDMPLLLRRMIWELMDPQRAIPLVHRTRILFFLVLLAVYVFSPFDVIPEGMFPKQILVSTHYVENTCFCKWCPGSR